MSEMYDLIVLGSGPGGYVAAIRAAQLGLKTAIVERENLGGICLNWGCIPTKALLRSAEIYHYMQHAKDYGLAAEKISADIDAVVKRSRGVAKQLNQGVTHLMKKNKIAVHMGEGKLTGPGKLEVTGEKGMETLSARHIIIATGARARDLPFAPADGKRIWTYRHAMTPPEMPSKLLVIGSGAIGIEFASFYNDMGADVTVVEMMDRVVPVEDADVSAFLEKALTKQGMTIMTGAGVEELKTSATGVSAKIKGKDGKIVSGEFSHASSPSASSPIPRISGWKRWASNRKGHIKTDGLCRTNVEGIWAIGDITAPPWLAHKASHEGVIAAEAIAQALGNKDVHPHAMDPATFPAAPIATRRSPASA
jgi:dihydrolipoamide dehydrogenase